MPYLFSSAAARAARAESLATLAETSHALLNASEQMLALSTAFSRNLLNSSAAWQLPASPALAVSQQGEQAAALRRHLPQLIGSSVQIATDTQALLAKTFRAHVDCTRQLVLDTVAPAESAAPWEIHPWLRTLHQAIDSSALAVSDVASRTLQQAEQAQQQVQQVVSRANGSPRPSRSTPAA